MSWVAPHGYGWPRYAWAVFVSGLAYAAAGPPIGAVFSPGVVVYPAAVMMAYFTSTPSAFAAGCAMAILAPRSMKPAARLGVALGVGAVFGAMATLAFAFITPSSFLWLNPTWVLIHAFAGAMACVFCTGCFSGLRLG